MDNDEFDNLLRRAMDGEVAATSELLKRCQPEIHKMIRSKLSRKIRSKFDSQDFLQAVWKSVLTKDKDKDGDGDTQTETAPRFEGESHFVKYVSGVAKHKVLEQFRRHTKTGKYNVELEESLYIFRGKHEFTRDLPAPDPTPSQDAQATDRLARILEGRSDLERTVVILKRQGMTYIEIAKKTGIGEASVRRMIEGFRKREENRGWE